MNTGLRVYMFLFFVAVTEISQRDSSSTNVDYINENIDTNSLSHSNDLDSNRISPLDNQINHNIISDKNKANNSTRHADSENAVVFSNGCDKHRQKTVNLNVTFSCDDGNGYNTLYGDTNATTNNNFTNGNNSDNITLSCSNGKFQSIEVSVANANNSTNSIDFNDNPKNRKYYSVKS